MAFLIPIFITAFVFATISWIAYAVLEGMRSRQRIRAASELQGTLIDRLAGQDIAVFLTSENGSKLLRALSEQPVGDAAHARSLRALQSRLVLVTRGGGLFLYLSVRPLPLEVEDVVAMFATLCTALGGAAGRGRGVVPLTLPVPTPIDAAISA